MVSWHALWRSARLDGVISGCLFRFCQRAFPVLGMERFPNTYASKVGKTSDTMYKAPTRSLLIPAEWFLFCCPGLLLQLYVNDVLFDFSALYDPWQSSFSRKAARF